MNQDQKDLEKARELMFPIIGAIGKEVYLESEYPDNWKRAFGYIANALREERERTIDLCADVAASHRTNDLKYMWKACSAEIVEEILKLKTPPPS